MYFRFGAGILLIVVISVAGIAIEKSTLDVRRDISAQHFRMEVLRDEHIQLRLETQKLRSPGRMMDSIAAGKIKVQRPQPQSVRTLRHKANRL